MAERTDRGRYLRRARIDKNQNEIVDKLRGAGFSVMCLHTVGNGCPDLVIGRAGVTYLVEVKSKGGKLTEKQRIFFREWRGNALVARTFEQVIEKIEAKNDN